MNVAQSRLLALSEIAAKNPALFSAALARTRQQTGQLAGMGADETAAPSFWQKLSDNLLSMGTAYLTVKNQQDILKLNISRAEQGLPPIDASTSAPVVRTQVELPPDVVSKITSEAGSGLNKILLWGGAAFLAMLLIKRMK